MILKSKFFSYGLLIAMGFGLLIGWLKAEHRPQEAIQVAEVFLQKLATQRFAEAFEMTVKQGYVGNTPEALRQIAKSELCALQRQVSTFPFQSNGNRLRRLMSGNEVEMPQITVEFVGTCLLGVTLRRTSKNEWRVYRFASHAG